MMEHSEHGHEGRHEHLGRTSRGMFDDISVLEKIGVSEGHRFLDAGCADGHFSIAASQLVGASGHVFSYDIHEPSLELFREEVGWREIKNITVENKDVRQDLPVEDGTLDHFFMSNVMHGFVYNGESDQVILNMRRKLKRGGKLSFIEWDKENVERGPPKEHRLSFEEMKEILADKGFRPIFKDMASPQHVLMQFERT